MSVTGEEIIMTNIEIQNEIKRLEREIYSYNSRIKEEKKEQEKLLVDIKKSQESLDNTENQFQNIVQKIRNNAMNLSADNIFKDNYEQAVKNKLWNSRYLNARCNLENEREKMKRNVTECDERIEQYKKMIASYRQEIDDLKSKIISEV
jgi:chromosome segregation ATPase